MVRSFLLIAFFVCSFANSQAQLAASLKMNKRTYLAGEPVIAEITITNHSGQDLILASSRALPWLSFLVSDSRGNTVPTQRLNAFGSMKIKTGQSLARTVDLSQYFLLNTQGNFSASAVIRDPSGQIESTSTNRILFNLNPGRTYWSQKIGFVQGSKNEKREMKLLTFADKQKTKLYVQVNNTQTGLPLKTFPLGDAMMLRKPIVTLDGKQNMNVMYLATPAMWVHCQIDPNGKLLDRQIHKRASQGDPSLMAYPDGTVRVVNSILYDEKAAEVERSKIRKTSDRPQIITE